MTGGDGNEWPWLYSPRQHDGLFSLYQAWYAVQREAMARVTYSTAYAGTGHTEVCISLALRRCTAAIVSVHVYRHHA